MFDRIKNLLQSARAGAVHDRLEDLVKKTPIPVFWQFGKTQSGKTSIIKHLTGADDAEIGQGFRPCTRFSREYRYPTWEAPLLIFLDTRGLEEPGYDATEDLARFSKQAHVMIVTVRVLDFALEKLLRELRRIRDQNPSRPVVLALTCLHDAYPQQQHVEPYLFTECGLPPAERRGAAPAELLRAILAQREQFDGLCDFVVPIDLTPPGEGFHNPTYGSEKLKEVLVQTLPEAYRQTLLKLDEATRTLRNAYERRALPFILAYSSVAATAAAVPIPWIDLLILPGIQTQMVFQLARLYGQPLTGQRFLELASTLGLGMAVRQGIREFTKLIPVIGSIASAALAASATFALGKAFCYYYSAVHEGHVPKAEDLKRYYHEQLILAAKLWKTP